MEGKGLLLVNSFEGARSGEPGALRDIVSLVHDVHISKAHIRTQFEGEDTFEPVM